MLIAGAGMAGLVVAARVRELGLEPRVVEKGRRPGGSMLLSSGVVWRHREWEDFRAECPGGDRALQRLVWERLDDALDWLESLGAEPVWTETGNPRTVGRRYDPRSLTALLARGVELETPLPADAGPPLVLACGGFAARLAAERGLLLRANPWSDGAALDHARARGAAVSAGMDEFYGRVMPAPPARIREEDFVPLAQLYGRWARVYDDEGRDLTPASVAWHESDLAQRIGSRVWYVLDDTGLEHGRERVAAARAAGGTVLDPRELPFATPPGSRVAVHVAAAVTHTIGGLVVDTEARVLGRDGVPLDGLWAAGVDAGGVATGGYASGLAQALVLGLAAAESTAAG
ncbi:MAG TPA: FAD-binding protein [Gaiellaceae bacterium]|nr:FAD-binding protein [Gaiellaceae bacterium]